MVTMDLQYELTDKEVVGDLAKALCRDKSKMSRKDGLFRFP